MSITLSRHNAMLTARGPEIDISVSKLLGFETFAKSLRVSVSENLVSEKKSRFRFRKNLVSEKGLGFGFGKFGIVKKVSVSVSVNILVSSFSALDHIRTLASLPSWSFFCPKWAILDPLCVSDYKDE